MKSANQSNRGFHNVLLMTQEKLARRNEVLNPPISPWRDEASSGFLSVWRKQYWRRGSVQTGEWHWDVTI